ncbi:hypothetical protein CAEBREN_19604 [Caenorhabditis brenneri]|uniref:DUF281 domain-containing protein n=1 Tax=Caenorhabditis brenneri TaxID=135651 RepID=G0P5V9_CAEBE|nr:hypothetical protein CAEBREN_19604 [Caenorhabditis brenneri]
MKTIIFYFLFLLNSADSCLKINYAEPRNFIFAFLEPINLISAACACKSVALDSSNLQNEIGNLPIYPHLYAYPLKAPTISVDDCSGTVYCEGDYSLVVFDTDKVTNVEKCDCQFKTLYRLNLMREVGETDIYYNLSTYPIEGSHTPLYGCNGTLSCDPNYDLIVFNDENKYFMYGKNPAEGYRDASSHQWKVNDGSGNYFSTSRTGVCVDYSPPTNCKSCRNVLDIFQAPTDDQGYYYFAIDQEGIKECRLMILGCVRNSTEEHCESSTVYAVNNVGTYNVTTIMSAITTESYLLCGDNGVYTERYPRGLLVENISKVYCEFKNCVKKVPA